MSEDYLAVRVEVTGRVQGVGYRHWTNLRATRAGLTGFVRNLGNGSVEAVFAGPMKDVDDMVIRCRVGPRGADVTGIRVEPWDGAAFDGFSVLPTV
jgi:acylphosphatase